MNLGSHQPPNGTHDRSDTDLSYHLRLPWSSTRWSTAPLWFCPKPFTSLLKRSNKGSPVCTWNVWYLDDGTLCGSCEDLSAPLSIIEEEDPSRGLHLNRSKALLSVPSDADVSKNLLPPDIPISRDGFVLLGSPKGPPSFCAFLSFKEWGGSKRSFSQFLDLEDSQTEAVLLHSCFALPKYFFTLWTHPPGVIKEAITAFYAPYNWLFMQTQHLRKYASKTKIA